MQHVETIMTTRLLLALAAALGGGPGLAHGNDLPAPIRARHGEMALMALHLGTLGGMARGNTRYDPESAATAAGNLVAISTIDQRFLWPDGTSSDEIGGSKALPVIWDNYDDFLAKWTAFGEAATGMEAVAGDGLEALQGAMPALGRSCGGCHDDYRISDD